MMEGWIKLHRLLQNWEWFNDSQTVHLFLTILLNANHVDGNWRGVIVKRGQWITGRKKLSTITGISERSIRTILQRLEKTGELTIKPTNKFSLITVVKWDSYQIDEAINDQPDANKRPANDQQPTTNKNEENEKNEKKEDSLDIWVRKEIHKVIGRTMNSTEFGKLPIVTAYSREQIETALQKTKAGKGNSLNYLLKVLQDTPAPAPFKEVMI